MSTDQALFARSKVKQPSDLMSIGCQENNQELMALKSSKRLMVQPIWVNPVDKFEGGLYRNYIKAHPEYRQIYVRKSVANMLDIATANLPERYKLVIRAGHRPLGVQLTLLSTLKVQYLLEHPKAGAKEALAYARTFVSDPAAKIPPHCCGAAVDVDLIDNTTGELVDFGCPMNTDNELAFLHSKQISTSQRKSRIILLEAMLSAGFASNYYEWWHYSYGDQKWAWFYGKPQAIYNIKEPRL